MVSVYTWIARFCIHLQWCFQNLMFPSRCLQDFVTGLSILLRGTVREKLEWTFHLYDINRDGYINREVMLCSHAVCLHINLKSRCSVISAFLPGNDRDCESHLWHDGQIHLPCAEGRRPTAACGRFLSGLFVITQTKHSSPFNRAKRKQHTGVPSANANLILSYNSHFTALTRFRSYRKWIKTKMEW